MGSIKNSPWYSPLHLYDANNRQLCLDRHHSNPQQDLVWYVSSKREVDKIVTNWTYLSTPISSVRGKHPQIDILYLCLSENQLSPTIQINSPICSQWDTIDPYHHPNVQTGG